jgi:hypothetical protein
MEGRGGDVPDDGGVEPHAEQDREQPPAPGALARRDAVGDLLLHGEDAAKEVPVLLEDLEEDGGGEMVGKVSHQGQRARPGDGREVQPGRVGGDAR